MCRSRRELSNKHLLAKFGFDTAENEPCKVCRIPTNCHPRIHASRSHRKLMRWRGTEEHASTLWKSEVTHRLDLLKSMVGGLDVGLERERLNQEVTVNAALQGLMARAAQVSAKAASNGANAYGADKDTSE